MRVMFVGGIREIWDGSRSGVEGALSFFGADEVEISTLSVCVK